MRRFDDVPGLAERVHPLAVEAVGDFVEAVTREWRAIKQAEPAAWWIHTFNISDATTAGVRAILESNGPADAGRVRLVWPFDRFVAEMEGHDVIRFYDELWYPSRDDLLVVRSDHQMFVEFNHEEMLTIGYVLAI